MNNLVIVESPAKAKTIKKYLGNAYEVTSSMGHIRDLPPTRLSVDVKNNFEPKYQIIKGKEEIVKNLKQKAKTAKKVFLATDPDREGEAISWHLANILGLDLSEENRITFNEITKSGVQKGIELPRKVDLNLVNAQQTRRVLDRLVGYKVSPFLSQKIYKGLSAGRVQSVALRMIVDREDNIRKFVPVEYWTIDAQFIPKGTRKSFGATFYGDESGKVEIENEEKANTILSILEGSNYKIGKLKKGKRKRSSAPPFITSTLQQEASRKLGFTAKRTMFAAQQLYEGIEIDENGPTGLITYMRTDSLRVSEDAIKSAREYILDKWGKKYLPSTERRFKVKANAQDGHEAIRPTNPKLYPESIKQSLSSDQYKIYKLIWERFIASQMADCMQNTVQVDIISEKEGFDKKYIFKASTYTIAFDGFMILYVEGKDEEVEKAKSFPELKEDMDLKLKNIDSIQHFTQPPARYTEASLIKSLEEEGIGRPSTYAAIISTITARQYVKKQAKSLFPTELGEVVNKIMKERFSKIVNLKFTAAMEHELDEVADGKINWTKPLENFYEDLIKMLDKAKQDMQGVKIILEEDKIDQTCELCGKPMVIKRGRYGKFIGCTGYPECKNIKKIIEEIGVQCPKCGGKIIKRRSKRDKVFYGCGNFPNCKFISWDEPLNEKCPKCSSILFKKIGKKSKIYCKNEECKYEKVIENE